MPGSAPRFVRRRDVQMVARTMPARMHNAYVRIVNGPIVNDAQAGSGLGMLACKLLNTANTR